MLIMTQRRWIAIVPACVAAVVGVDVVSNYFVPMFWHISSSVPITRNPYAGAPYVSAIRDRERGKLRVASVGGPLWPDWAGAMRLDSPESLNGMYPSRFMPFLNTFLKGRNPDSRDLLGRFDASGNPSFTTPAAQRWMTLSSVGYIVVPAGLVISDPHLTRIHDGDAWVYAYDAALPRASIFHDVRWVRDDRAALNALRDPRTDVRRTLVLTGSPTRAEQALTRVPAGESARIVHRDVASMDIEAELSRPGYVMSNDTYFPGWTASVDGAAVSILNADYLFRAVRLDAGRHQIRYEYRSGATLLGTLLTLLGLLAAVGCFWFARRRRAAVIVAT
ncbi:MAG: hypothetical protein NVS4B13_06940 [Candidatus Elarobacter sp.]